MTASDSYHMANTDLTNLPKLRQIQFFSLNVAMSEVSKQIIMPDCCVCVLISCHL